MSTTCFSDSGGSLQGHPWTETPSFNFMQFLEKFGKIISVVDPRGAPTDQNFLNFMQFFGKICMLAPSPGGLALPPTGIPGSAPACVGAPNLGEILDPPLELRISNQERRPKTSFDWTLDLTLAVRPTYRAH